MGTARIFVRMQGMDIQPEEARSSCGLLCLSASAHRQRSLYICATPRNWRQTRARPLEAIVSDWLWSVACIGVEMLFQYGKTGHTALTAHHRKCNEHAPLISIFSSSMTSLSKIGRA